MHRRLLASLIGASLFAASWTTPAHAETRYIVRSSGGLTAIQNLCRLIGCGLIRSLEDPLAQVFLITTNDNQLLTSLRSIILTLGITDVELDLPLSVLPEDYKPGLSPAASMSAGDLTSGVYAKQPANSVVRASEARSKFKANGAGIVALIDTGVEPHPALRDVLVPGYDFTRDQYGTASETADVNQSTAAVLDNSPPAHNAWGVAALNQSTAAVLDDPRYAAFGHGTMVAGIVHLVAPEAGIMPLKVFHSDGSGYTSDILRAIHLAVRWNARVINMSFSMPAPSKELERAVLFAVSQQVVCVASVGNDGTKTLVYPAAFDSVMGVASTDYTDRRSTFSNYGAQLVWVAAPGEGIVSTYPYETYGAGWGTSFSAPFVSGAVALLLNIRSNLNQSSAAAAIANAKPVDPDLGAGRLDIVWAMQAIQ